MAVTSKCRYHLVTVFFSNGFLKTFQECFVFYMQREVMAEDEVKLVNVSYCHNNNNNSVKISNDLCNGDVVFLLLCLSVCLLSVIDYFALLGCCFFVFFLGYKTSLIISVLLNCRQIKQSYLLYWLSWPNLISFVSHSKLFVILIHVQNSGKWWT